MHHLRPATTADVAFLTDVVITATRHQGRLPTDFDETEYRAGFAEWTVEQIADPTAHGQTSVIEVDGRPVGRLRVVRDDDGIELCGLQLLPSVQGAGVGTAVIAELVAEAVAADVGLRLSVEIDNPRALALYRRLGLVETGRSESDVHLETR